MHHTKSDRLSSIPTATGGIARLACERLRRAGKDLAQLVSKAGLTIEMIDDPGHRIDTSAQIRFLELAAEELQDDYLGFGLAQDFDLGKIGLVYYVMASSENLAEALRNVERYSTLNDEGVSLRVSFDRATEVALSYVGVERRSSRHHVEFWLVTLVRICRRLADSRLSPRQIRVRHYRPETPHEARTFLGCGIEFGASADEIVFADSVASLPSVCADIYLNKLLLDYADEALEKRKLNRSNLRSRVEEMIVQVLPHGGASAGDIAGRLGMSRRTLARALSAEGATFSEVLEQLRIALAKRYLSERELPISEIAWLLGYGETSSFTNAFVRWTGVTPRGFRAGPGSPSGQLAEST
jgi:AraC-like DNA-binding protein